MLKNPHPFIFNHFSVVIPTCITFIVLLVLRPFEFAEFPTRQLITWSAIFATLVGATVFLSVSAVKKKFHQTIEKNWTVGKEIALVLFALTTISLMVFALFLMLNPQSNWVNLFGLVVIRTLAISVFPVLILVLFEQNHHQKIKRREAEKLNQELLKKQKVLHQETLAPIPPPKLILVAENQKVALQLPLIDLLFL